MIIYLINWIIWSFVQSIVFTGVFIYLFYWFYVKKLPSVPVDTGPQYEQFILDDALIAMIDRNKDGLNGESNSAIAVNMLLQFLFQELKDTKSVRRYINRKIAIEFEDLLTTKTAGKFIERLSAKDFSLGTSFPIIHSFKLISYEMDSTKKLIDEMSILVDIEYRNGFSISIDADLIFGKSAYTHVKIALIKGKARILFSRQPFTHWSFAFVEEPIIEIEGSSQFDGKPMPKLTYLITNQLRKSIRRKHTLPNYKIRFKPFFEVLYSEKLYKSNINEILAKKRNLKKQQIVNNQKNNKSENIQYQILRNKLDVDLTSIGHLKVNLKQCDRLPEALYSLNLNQTNKPSENQNMPKSSSSNQLVAANSSPNSEKDHCYIYLTSSVDKYSMENLIEKRITRENWPFIEFEIQKTSQNQFIGINFMEVFFINRTELCIQKIFPNSLASKVKTIRLFDILYSINQVPCSSIKTLNKLLQKSGLQTLKFVVQRPIIVSDKPVVKVSSFPVRLSANIDEETNSQFDAEGLSQKIQNDNINMTQNVSAGCLIDYYCGVSECAYGEDLGPLDLISFFTDFEQEQGQERFQKTREIKLDKENLFSVAKNRLPIRIEDTYDFKLNETTLYLNIFLWTVQYLQKSTRKKPLLIGYVTVPLDELSVDCWSTTKGETQSTYYFRPVELKASALSKIAKSHVVSDHLGFDPKISLGNITVNFQHVIDSDNVDTKDVTNKISKDLVENNLLEAELIKQEENKYSRPNVEVLEDIHDDPNDDGSQHKFLSVQFNQTVSCHSCNKKIWFKSAYQCAYCGSIIHIKCYDKAINKTICPRFYTKNPYLDPDFPGDKERNSESGNDDSFVILADDIVQQKTKRRSKSPSELSISSIVSDTSSISNLKQKFTKYLRQRTVTKAEESEYKVVKSTANLIGYIRGKKKEFTEEFKPAKIDDNLDESDEFKDIDPNNEAGLFGTELFDDLSGPERILKFEEQIAKYDHTIEVMTVQKNDLEKELEEVLRLKTANKSHKKLNGLDHQEINLKTQINHLNEKIKCVLFLLMQCKLGLENLNQQVPSEDVQLKNSAAHGSQSDSSNSSLEENFINQSLH